MKSRNLLLSLVLAVALFASSCASVAIGETAYPDSDPTHDVDYIGEAVTMTRAELESRQQ
jgi:hypothetical protein